MNKSKAFTLIELLLVCSLIAIVGAAIFQVFNNGLKLWARAERLNGQSDVSIFLDKMREDLSASVMVSGLEFQGTQEQVSFPTIVLTRADSKSSRSAEGIVDQIGAVQYRFDMAERAIFRRQANYAQAIKGQWSTEVSKIASGIENVSFRYEMISGRNFTFKPRTNEDVPLGILIEVNFKDENGKHKMTRYLPVLTKGI